MKNINVQNNNILHRKNKTVIKFNGFAVKKLGYNHPFRDIQKRVTHVTIFFKNSTIPIWAL